MQLISCVVVVSLLSLFVIGQNSTASPAMSREEKIVRSAYAKLAFASQVRALHEIIDRNDLKPGSIDETAFAQAMKEGEISFQLSNIRVGDFADISNVKYSDLVTKPNGEDVLSVTIGFWTHSTDYPKETRSAIATPAWTKAQLLTENWNVPFGNMFKMAKDAGAEDLSPYHRYAAVDVKVAFQGRSRTYHALFMFGEDEKGTERILVVDMVTGGSALNFYIHNSVYPATLLETDMRNIPFVSRWLRDNSVNGATAGTREAICDLQSLRCGVASEDVQRTLSPKTTSHRALRPLQPGPHLVLAGFHPRIPRQFFMQSDPCSVFSTSSGPTPGQTPFDQQLHITGGHFMSFNQSNSCVYSSGNNSNGGCNTNCKSSIGGMANETGLTSSSCHVAQVSQQVGGTAQGTGAGASCASSIAMGVKACLACVCNVTFSVSGQGASVSLTSDGFYTVQQNNSNNCGLQIPGGGGGNPGGCTPNPDGVTVSGGPTGSSFQSPNPNPPDPCTVSPIVIDTDGRGFHLTSADDGVIFDMEGNGHPLKMAWTDPHFANAFLALPAPDGLVHDGKQLFGNYTPQPPSSRPNGFLALAEFDKPGNGGNGDGIIDEKDAIFSQLRLWIDENHDGICQANEMHTLRELGVSSISLRYHFSRRDDQYDNIFRYRARLNPESPADESEVGKTVYDVFFVTK